MIVWQDLLDLIQAGRTDLTCPFCQKAQVQVSERGRLTHIECPSCRKFIEGSMQAD